jgi:hypothetical protein
MVEIGSVPPEGEIGTNAWEACAPKSSSGCILDTKLATDMSAIKVIDGFWKDDRSYRGHKLVEYSLLIALAVLGSSAISPKVHGGDPAAGTARAALLGGE